MGGKYKVKQNRGENTLFGMIYFMYSDMHIKNLFAENN